MRSRREIKGEGLRSSELKRMSSDPSKYTASPCPVSPVNFNLDKIEGNNLLKQVEETKTPPSD